MLELSLLGAVVVFASALAVSIAAPGTRLQLGPVRVSLTDTSRVAFQASLVMLGWTFAWTFQRFKRSATLLSLGLVIAAAVGDSFPRRVGDGAEYMAIALNIGRGSGPSLSPPEKQWVGERLSLTSGFDSSPLDYPLVASDGRQDFPHFWLFPLVAAPLTLVTDGLGLHPNFAFTAVNIGLVIGFAWMLAARDDRLLAALFVAGPLVWWIDKAHAEVFMAVLIATSVYCLERRPRVALLAAGLVSAQNPAAGGLLVVVAASLFATGRRPYATLAASLAIAAINPVYYLIRLGRVSPLLDAGSIGLPGLRNLLTPLVDPNLGLLFYAPVYCAAVVVGLVWARRHTVLCVASICVFMLAMFTHTHNVNHGGTPGMSRYALWLMAACLPLASATTRVVDGRMPGVAFLAIAVTAATSWMAFRPALDEQRRDSPSMLASAIWNHWPALDEPLPEVFAERASGVDGVPPVPTSVADCAKLLVRGDGAEAWFPFPCQPQSAPPPCVVTDALCYVDHGRFSLAPRQQGFAWTPRPEHSWSVRTQQRLSRLHTMLGETSKVVRLTEAQRIRYGTGVASLWVVEGRAGTAVWVYPLPGETVQLYLTLTRPADLRVQMQVDQAQTSVRLQPGEHTVPLDLSDAALVTLVDLP